MDCCKIQVLDIPSTVPDRFLDDNGNLFLTVDPETGTELYKQLSEQSILSKLKVDGVLGFTLPDDDRNETVLDAFFDPNAVDIDYNPILIYLWTGGRPDMLISLYVLGRTESREYEVELRAGDEHWAVQLKNLPINEIPFEDFEVTRGNLVNNWFNYNKYEDGEPGYAFPMVDYGYWIYDKYYGYGDFRPWVHAAALLQRAFCEIGWVLDDSFLFSEHGRRLICYLHKVSYGRDRFEEEDESFRVQIEGTPYQTEYFGFIEPPPPFNVYVGTGYNVIEQWHIVKWDNVVSNPNTYYDPVTGSFQGIGVYQFVAEMDMIFGYDKNAFDNTRSVLFVELMQKKADGSSILLDEYVMQPLNGRFGRTRNGVVSKFTLVSEDIAMHPGDSVWVRYYWDGDDDITEIIINQSSAFYGYRKGSWFDIGDTIKFEDVLDPNISAFDVLAGITHMYKGLFYTDWATRTVKIRPPFKVEDIYETEEDIEGFYLETQAYDLIKLMRCDSDVITTPNLENLNRYYRLKFRDSTDSYIQENNLDEKDTPLYSRVTDLQAGKNDDETVDENPLFEPTINRVSQGAPNINGAPELPICHDNTEGELSFDIGPRVLYMVDMQSIKVKYSGGNTKIVRLDYFGTPDDEPHSEMNRYPFAYQRTKAAPATGEFKPNFTFDSENFSLYSYFYDRWLKEQFLTQRISIEGFLTPEDYFKLDFRQLCTLLVNGRPVYARLQKIEGYNSCSNSITPISLSPLLQSLDCIVPGTNLIPGDDTDAQTPGRCPGNNPELVITENGNCFDFSMGGENTNVVDNVVFEYMLDDTEIWVQANQLCDPPRGFTVRMIVSYAADCPEEIRKKYVDPCGNAPELVLEYDYVNDCITAEIGGVNSSTIDEAATVIEYTIDGGPVQTYNGPVCDVTGEICFTATVVYTDGCEDREIEACLTVPEVPVDCEDIKEAVTISCEVQADGSIKIVRDNSLDELVIALDFIKIRPAGGTDADWKTYNGENIYDCPIEAQWVVLTCDGQCPPICSPIITCDCDTTPPCLIEVILRRTGANELTADVTGATNIEYTWFEWDDAGNQWVEITGTTGPVLSGIQPGVEYMVHVKDLDIPTCVDQDEYIIPEDCIPPELSIVSETNDNGQIDIEFEVTGIGGINDITVTANGSPVTVNDASPPADHYSISYTAAPGETNVTILIEATNACDTTSWTKDYPICYDPTVTIDNTIDNTCGKYDLEITTTNIDAVGEIAVDAPYDSITDNGGGSWTIVNVDAGTGNGNTTVTVTVTNECGSDQASVDLAQCPPPTITLENEYVDGSEYVIEFSTTNVNGIGDITGLANGLSPSSLTWDAGTETGEMRFNLEPDENTWSIEVSTCCGTDSINGTYDNSAPPEGTQQNTLTC